MAVASRICLISVSSLTGRAVMMHLKTTNTQDLNLRRDLRGQKNTSCHLLQPSPKYIPSRPSTTQESWRQEARRAQAPWLWSPREKQQRLPPRTWTPRAPQREPPWEELQPKQEQEWQQRKEQGQGAQRRQRWESSPHPDSSQPITTAQGTRPRRSGAPDSSRAVHLWCSCRHLWAGERKEF